MFLLTDQGTRDNTNKWSLFNMHSLLLFARTRFVPKTHVKMCVDHCCSMMGNNVLFRGSTKISNSLFFFCRKKGKLNRAPHKRRSPRCYKLVLPLFLNTFTRGAIFTNSGAQQMNLHFKFPLRSCTPFVYLYIFTWMRAFFSLAACFIQWPGWCILYLYWKSLRKM